MAKDDKVKKLRAESRRTANKGLDAPKGFAVPPRKAMANARKASKGLAYPLPPYPTANIIGVSRWLSLEWQNLGRWKSLAAPLMIVVALLTWEKEKAMQEEYLDSLERRELKQKAVHIYAYQQPRKRKLLGIIPLPGR